MAKMMETVLYYNPGRPETMKHVAMMKSVLVRMGVRIRNIGPEQVLEKVGYLAGMEGYEAAGGSAGADGASTQIIDLSGGNTPFFTCFFQCHIIHIISLQYRLLYFFCSKNTSS